ncbi:hypothetical protein OO17_20945 [Rhodopseudomonas palustris]|uniref:Uncharacterized protein n=1 Tax=Rhodopseudomonas palustris TaxID=1076 RepID=A0A0D7EFF9_RHOPL|nr:hypothetical protein OO17_20945 [Rhodopseudomonas palustris]
MGKANITRRGCSVSAANLENYGSMALIQAVDGCLVVAGALMGEPSLYRGACRSAIDAGPAFQRLHIFDTQSPDSVKAVELF